MDKRITFGKVDYNGKGRRNCEVDVEIQFNKDEGGDWRLSICGDIWNPHHTDIYSGGQNLETIKKFLSDNSLFMEIYDLWKKYHLNFLKAGTIKQTNYLNKWYAEHGEQRHDYTKSCEILREAGLLVDELTEGEVYSDHDTTTRNIKRYEYGTSWILHRIPEADVERILKLFK